MFRAKVVRRSQRPTELSDPAGWFPPERRYPRDRLAIRESKAILEDSIRINRNTKYLETYRSDSLDISDSPWGRIRRPNDTDRQKLGPCNCLG